MAQVITENILVGHGDMYYASKGTALPTFATGSASVRDDFDGDNNWTYAGATQEGVELQYQPDVGEVEIDQFKDAALLFNQGLTVTMNTNLVEATLEHLLIAWGLPDSDLTVSGDVDTFSIGTPDEDVVERAVVVIGKGAPTATGAGNTTDGTARDRIYQGYRVVSIEGSTLALRRTEATMFPVSFRLLPDAANSNKYGNIIDRVPGTA